MKSFKTISGAMSFLKKKTTLLGLSPDVAAKRSAALTAITAYRKAFIKEAKLKKFNTNPPLRFQHRAQPQLQKSAEDDDVKGCKRQKTLMEYANRSASSTSADDHVAAVEEAAPTELDSMSQASSVASAVPTTLTQQSTGDDDGMPPSDGGSRAAPSSSSGFWSVYSNEAENVTYKFWCGRSSTSHFP